MAHLYSNLTKPSPGRGCDHLHPGSSSRPRGGWHSLARHRWPRGLPHGHVLRAFSPCLGAGRLRRRGARESCAYMHSRVEATQRRLPSTGAMRWGCSWGLKARWLGSPGQEGLGLPMADGTGVGRAMERGRLWTTRAVGSPDRHRNGEAGRLGGDCPGSLLLPLHLPCPGLRLWTLVMGDSKSSQPAPCLQPQRRGSCHLGAGMTGCSLLSGPLPLPQALEARRPAGQVGIGGHDQAWAEVNKQQCSVSIGSQRSRSSFSPSGAQRLAWL